MFRINSYQVLGVKTPLKITRKSHQKHESDIKIFRVDRNYKDDRDDIYLRQGELGFGSYLCVLQ